MTILGTIDIQSMNFFTAFCISSRECKNTFLLLNFSAKTLLYSILLTYSPPKSPTTSSAGGMGKPPWGKTFAFPPKGGLANRSFFTGRPLKSGSLLMLHPISFVLFLNILLYRLFIYITDCLAIISSCPEMTIPFLSIFLMSVKYHKRTLAFNKAYGL